MPRDATRLVACRWRVQADVAELKALTKAMDDREDAVSRGMTVNGQRYEVRGALVARVRHADVELAARLFMRLVPRAHVPRSSCGQRCLVGSRVCAGPVQPPSHYLGSSSASAASSRCKLAHCSCACLSHSKPMLRPTPPRRCTGTTLRWCMAAPWAWPTPTSARARRCAWSRTARSRGGHATGSSPTSERGGPQAASRGSGDAGLVWRRGRRGLTQRSGGRRAVCTQRCRWPCLAVTTKLEANWMSGPHA